MRTLLISKFYSISPSVHSRLGGSPPIMQQTMIQPSKHLLMLSLKQRLITIVSVESGMLCSMLPTKNRLQLNSNYAGAWNMPSIWQQIISRRLLLCRAALKLMKRRVKMLTRRMHLTRPWHSSHRYFEQLVAFVLLIFIY